MPTNVSVHQYTTNDKLLYKYEYKYSAGEEGAKAQSQSISIKIRITYLHPQRLHSAGATLINGETVREVNHLENNILMACDKQLKKNADKDLGMYSYNSYRLT